MLLTLPILEVLPATPRSRVVRLDLQGARFAYQPGQAVFVGLHGDKRRPYSIASAPGDADRLGWLELLVGVDASFSDLFAATWTPGTMLDVEGPVGRFTFPYDPPSQRFTFIAGGTGIAPLRSMLRHALETPHKKISVLYSARTPDEFAYEDELRALAMEGRIHLHQTVTRGEDSDAWRGGRGRIGHAELQPIAEDPETLCFICGPRPLVNDATRLLGELGAPRERIRIEEW